MIQSWGRRCSKKEGMSAPFKAWMWTKGTQSCTAAKEVQDSSLTTKPSTEGENQTPNSTTETPERKQSFAATFLPSSERARIMVGSTQGSRSSEWTEFAVFSITVIRCPFCPAILQQLRPTEAGHTPYSWCHSSWGSSILFTYGLPNRAAED